MQICRVDLRVFTGTYKQVSCVEGGSSFARLCFKWELFCGLRIGLTCLGSTHTAFVAECDSVVLHHDGPFSTLRIQSVQIPISRPRFHSKNDRNPSLNSICRAVSTEIRKLKKELSYILVIFSREFQLEKWLATKTYMFIYENVNFIFWHMIPLTPKHGAGHAREPVRPFRILNHASS